MATLFKEHGWPGRRRALDGQRDRLPGGDHRLRHRGADRGCACAVAARGRTDDARTDERDRGSAGLNRGSPGPARSSSTTSTGLLKRARRGTQPALSARHPPSCATTTRRQSASFVEQTISHRCPARAHRRTSSGDWPHLQGPIRASRLLTEQSGHYVGADAPVARDPSGPKRPRRRGLSCPR